MLFDRQQPLLFLDSIGNSPAWISRLAARAFGTNYPVRAVFSLSRVHLIPDTLKLLNFVGLIIRLTPRPLQNYNQIAQWA